MNLEDIIGPHMEAQVNLDRFDDNSYLPKNNSKKTKKELTEYINDISHSVKASIENSINILTPWFFNNMPNIYYETTKRSEKVKHLSAIITGNIFEAGQTVELWNQEHDKVTYLGPGEEIKTLIDLAEKIETLNIKLGSLYFSKDRKLFIATFYSSHKIKIDLKNKYNNEKITATQEMLEQQYPQIKEEINYFLEDLDQDLVNNANPNRLFIIFKMYLHLVYNESSHTLLEKIKRPTSYGSALDLRIFLFPKR